MEIRQISGIFISHFDDSVLRLTYGKMLTFDTLESIKFPTLLENYKYKHFIRPNYLLNIEIIKTRKNWILKDIISHQEIYKPHQFSDFTDLCELIKLLKENIKEEQKTDALELTVGYLQKVNKIKIPEFETLLSRSLGFA